MLRVLRSMALLWSSALLVLAPFAAGYVVGHGDGSGRPRTPFAGWLSELGLVASPSQRAPVPGPSPELDELFKPFWETWGYVNRDFVDESAVQPQRMARFAIRGMLGALDDPYSLYLDPVHREVSDADLRGAFDGIGVQVEMVEDLLRIVSPLDGSPGQRAGLRPGDVIAAIDGEEIKGVNLTDAVRMIRGPRGSSITVTVRREGRANFDVTMKREEIRLPAVRGEVRPDGIGYLRISNFSVRVGSDLRETLDKLNEGSPRGWILDLRGNPGGYLDGAVAVTSQFINDAVVLYEERRDGNREELRTRGHARAATGPIAILVDKGTASAAEIVAAALRDHGRATLIGDQTYGKGTVQVVHTLSDGSALRLTVAKWLTPRGEPIQKIGLSPSIQVSESVDGVEGDRGLAEAVDFILQRNAVAGGGPQAALEPTEESGSVPKVAASEPDSTSAAPSTESSDDLRSVVLLDSDERDFSSAASVTV